jgi:hypothetical protein
MSNKITTKSYTIKRLRDMGYTVDKMDSIEYLPTDNRKWTIIMDNGGMTILVTCYKDDSLHLYDGGRYLNTSMKLNTDSVEVLAEFLNSRGLIHKHPRYGKKREETTAPTE